MSQEKVEVAKAFYDAYNARNSEALDRLLHPEAGITTVSARGGLGGEWSRATTREYFDQLGEAWTDLRIEIDDYRAVGERVDAQIVLVDSYGNWKDALEAVGLRE
jgi:hypothetical protein